MQAILKGKHQRFCKWLQDIRDRQIADSQLDNLEKEMLHFYEIYQQKREELRKIISGYEERQQSIRNKIREYKRQDFKTGNTIHPINEKGLAV